MEEKNAKHEHIYVQNLIFDNCTYAQIVKLIDYLTLKSEINKYYIFRNESEIKLVKVKDLS